MPKPEAEKLMIHDLFTRPIQPICNWSEYLERWQVAATLEEMIGLLHVGFTVPLESYRYGETKYDVIDRLIFYFKIADGWEDSYLLQVPSDEETKYTFGRDRYGNVQRKTSSELRQLLALKAFDMLCLNFFRGILCDPHDSRRRFEWLWEEVITSDRLFPITQNFFRAENVGFGNRVSIRNLSRGGGQSHNEKQSVEFLLNLGRFMWRWKEPDIPSWSSDKDKLEKQILAMRARLDAAKPWMVEVLSQLGEIGLLREWILELNTTCLGKLKEIALRGELENYQHPVKESRAVRTLDEACFIGSREAWFLKEYELKKGERNRLGKILDAERRKEQADQKIKKLTSK